MKIQTLRYIIKEGFINTYRNKLMTLASISIVLASLIVFGIFFIIIFNINASMKLLKEQPHIIAYCHEAIEDFEVEPIEKYIKESDKVASYEYRSREERFDMLKASLGENTDILEGLDASFLSPAFIIELKDPELSEEMVEELGKIPGIKKVDYSQRAINIISSISRWVKVISTLLLIVLVVVSIFIISNTIKLTVYARRKEISIMKYVGATDWFIKWPFIIEGIIIGLIGAIFALIVTGYGYNGVVARFNNQLATIGNEALHLVNFQEMGMGLVLFYTFMGIVVGGVGSLLSIRKYLRV